MNLTGADYIIAAAHEHGSGYELGEEFERMVQKATLDELPEIYDFARTPQEQLEPHELTALKVVAAAIQTAIEQGDVEVAQQTVVEALVVASRFCRLVDMKRRWDNGDDEFPT